VAGRIATVMVVSGWKRARTLTLPPKTVKLSERRA